jgi:hypothetical protein
MRLRRSGIAVIAAVALATTLGFARSRFPIAESPGLTIHEWGTFTTVAGADGYAIDWLPLSGPSDLPCFVGHVNANVIAKVLPGGQAAPQILSGQLPSRLFGKVRMETPVLYFYSADPVEANVSVTFRNGIITEFYPMPTDPVLPITAQTLIDPSFSHSLEWNVSVTPGVAPIFPNGGGKSHYYAARNTDATPITSGVQSEKFIFYRGVANFNVPIQAKVLGNGDVEVTDHIGEANIPAAILFESRGGRMGFSVARDIRTSATLPRPELNSDTAAIRAALRRELEHAGLYPKEAQAMLDTWSDSWFEEGARVFYMVPFLETSRVLPLHVRPEPASVTRVFVGRMELVNEATMNAVKGALLTGNDAALEPYNRFLSPIAQRIVASGTDAAMKRRLDSAAKASLGKYLAQVRACE